MRKIPTVFRRDPDDMRRLLREVNPECQWVLDGEGVGTRKYDGTCFMFDGEAWWARREVKPGKQAPDGFKAEQTDEVTGKTVGWEPAVQSAFAKFLTDGVAHGDAPPGAWEPGTYELCGPKVQGNPEGYSQHVLVAHKYADVVLASGGRYDFDALREIVARYGETGAEGIVWHHPDGRMAKLKARDFRA